ncbi:uncharacterized protein [Miscanthus floridulus]|uniref:uncharacterized protein n=1 Tax=Miscanthus floridulus TaxID=154761 RepID=UPI00345A5E98
MAVGKPDGGYVVVRHVSYRLLRANGRYYRLPLWNNAVSVDDVANYSKMMHWAVEAVPTSPTPPVTKFVGSPVLPAPTPNNRGVFRGLFLPQAEEPQRTIRVVLVDDHGNFPMLWGTFRFRGRSVYYLRWEVARLTGDALVPSRIVMCVRAGRYGRLTPLVVDLPLPRKEETLDIIVLIAGTPAAQALRYEC